VLAINKNSPWVDMSLQLANYPDTRLCSYSLMFRDSRRISIYQFHSIWFDQIGTRTHVLLYSMRAPLPHNDNITNVVQWYS